jgi:hypothetical protein
MSYALIYVSGKPLIKLHHSTYETGVHFYKKIVPLMEPSNWSRVCSSPTNKVISTHFTRNNCLLVGHSKQCLKDLGFRVQTIFQVLQQGLNT